MLRILALISLFWTISLVPATAQDVADDARAATGGAQTLEDILRRQEGLNLDESFRSDLTGDPDAAAAITEQLGTLGGASDPDLWRGVRYSNIDISTQERGPAATTLIQDGGMWWLEFRESTLLTFALYAMGGTLLALGLFYAIRGRIRIHGEKTGRTITRFKAFERFGHWLLASSFIILALTGIITLFGRKFLIPAFGHESFSALAVVSKWVHNNVSWAFMIALVIVFVVWVVHNIPDRTDLAWMAKAGGLFGGDHPPAKKFNAGQKMIFWGVIVLGGSISLSGLSLLFPFEFNLFGHTFSLLNSWGVPGWVGLSDLPYPLQPQEEMQFAQLWHALVSFVLIAVIFAHIYLGSVGMEGAFDAMGKGEVEEQWAREHHSIWAEEVAGPQHPKEGDA
ncbi:MAG: formate dehydrogenase subunit gamma [Yoonia sp.]|uniref:formate dehydrogenase subunit gamma n=1 Tax=Yoonia sp. TaxID=2212373 RepID=UPI003EF5D261